MLTKYDRIELRNYIMTLSAMHTRQEEEIMKDWNEITVMLKMTKSEAIAQLLKMGYQHEITYLIQDYYYLPSTADLSKDTLDLLNDMVLIRKFNESVKLTIKRKKI